MSKIKCEVIRDLMPLVIDEVASEESKQLVMQHMETCEGCKGYYSGMTAGISRSAAVPESDKAFIRLGKRMKRKLSFKKLLIWTLVVFVVCVGALFAWDQAHRWVVADHSNFVAQLAYDYDGKVYLKVDNQSGNGWYHSFGVERYGAIYYITPHEYAFTLKSGSDHAIQNIYELEMTEEGLCVAYYDYYEEIDEYGRVRSESREVRIPIEYVRFGTYDNYTTLYAPGDRLASLEEIHNDAFTVSDEEYPLIADKNMSAEESTPALIPEGSGEMSDSLGTMLQPTPAPVLQHEDSESMNRTAGESAQPTHAPETQPEVAGDMPEVGDVALPGQIGDDEG